MSDITNETKEEYIIPMNAMGKVIGPCTNSLLPDADKRLMVEFIIEGTIIYANMHIDELDTSNPNTRKRPRTQ